MLGFDRILIPVDFSPDSMAALRYGVALAKKLSGPQTVCVLYVADEESALATSRLGGRSSIELKGQLKHHGTEKLQEFVAQIDPGEENIEYAVVVGHPASKMICEYAEKEQFDMIVVGTAGKGAGASLRKMVLGSTSQQVQKQACCAVLSVKDPATSFADDDTSS